MHGPMSMKIHGAQTGLKLNSVGYIARKEDGVGV